MPFKAFLLIVALLFFGLCSSYAQTQDSNIPFKNPDLNLLENLLTKEIDRLRDSIGIHVLTKDEALTKAATLQAKYLLKLGKLTHVNQKKALTTPEGRVKKSKGLHHLVGENISMMVIGEPFLLPGGEKKVRLFTYGEVIQAVTRRWVKTRFWEANLLDPNYYLSGYALSYDKKRGRIFFVQVLGSLPPDLLAIPYPKKAYGTLPFDYNRCRSCENAVTRLTKRRISQRIRIKDRKIYFYFPDLEMFRNIYQSTEFSFAADVLLRSQFPCGSGNRLHGSPIHDGYMTEPIKRQDMLKYNLDNKGESLLVELGELPPEIDDQIEVNLLLLFRKTICKTLVTSPLTAFSLEPMPMELRMVTTNEGEEVRILRKRVNLIIPFEKDKYEYAREDIEPLYDSLRLNLFNIKAIDLTAYASVEGYVSRNELLQKKRAESIVEVLKSFELDTVETRIRTFENWSEFYRDISGTGFDQLRRLSREEVKAALRQDSMATAIEPLLKPHRKAEIGLSVEEKLVFDFDLNELSAYYQKSIAARESIKEMLRLQSALYSAVQSGRLPAQAWDSVPVPEEAGFIALINNDLVFNYVRKDSLPPFSRIEELAVLAKRRPDVLLNLFEIMAHYWLQDPSLIPEPEEFLKRIKSLHKAKGVSADRYYHLLYNFYLGASQAYSSRKQYGAAETSVNFIAQYYLHHEVSTEDALRLANFLVYHRMNEEATNLLRPYTEAEEVSEELLFYYLSLIVNQEFREEEGELVEKMRMARSMNQQRFCELFGKPELSFQLLRDYYLKKMYCESCEVKP